MTPHPFHPILASKRRLPFSVYTRDIIMTIVLWWVYLFFIKDLFYFFVDVAKWTWHGFADTQNYKSFEAVPTFLSYIEVIIILVVIYIGWARYNQMRFRGKNRRRAAPPVHAEDLAAFYNLETKEVEGWQQAKRLTIHHDHRGQIVKVERD